VANGGLHCREEGEVDGGNSTTFGGIPQAVPD